MTGEKGDGAPAELRARIEVLQEENRRLKRAFREARRSRYRKTGAALAGVGLGAGLAAAFIPGAREILIALAGTGIFSGLLVYYLSPEAFLSARTGERIYGAVAANYRDLSSELALESDPVYVPSRTRDRAILYLPQRGSDSIPEYEELEGERVVATEAGARGLSLHPTGSGLLEDFLEGLRGNLAEDLEGVGEQVADALVEQFEFAQTVEAEAYGETETLTLALKGTAFGDPGDIDHPSVSFAASATASVIGKKVEASVESGGERFDHLVVLEPKR